MKIAAGATILGLGGLAGFAMGSNPAADPQGVEATASQARLKPQTEVVRRTIHVPPRPDGSASAATLVGSTSSEPASPRTSGGEASAADYDDDEYEDEDYRDDDENERADEFEGEDD
jgi:hypothetical protein